LDSHDAIAIFHPSFWADSEGNEPAPYTLIAPEDVRSGKWRVQAKENEAPALRTLAVIEEKGLGGVMVWPAHCVVSTWGHQISENSLQGALQTWREKTGRPVRYIFKGENPYTDQFSIFEGLDDGYPETKFNEALFRELSSFDSVTFAGEALTHCVGESILSYVNRGGGKGQTVSLLADCTSLVAGCDGGEMTARLAAKNVLMIQTEASAR
jgi:nicotinamidase-related amidase